MFRALCPWSDAEVFLEGLLDMSAGLERRAGVDEANHVHVREPPAPGEPPPAGLISAFFELAVRYELKALAKEAADMMPGFVSVGNVKEILKVLHLYSDTCASAKEALEHVIGRVKKARTHDLFMAAALE